MVCFFIVPTKTQVAWFPRASNQSWNNDFHNIGSEFRTFCVVVGLLLLLVDARTEGCCGPPPLPPSNFATGARARGRAPARAHGRAPVALVSHSPTPGDNVLLWCCTRQHLVTTCCSGVALANTWWPPVALVLHSPTLGDHLSLWCYTRQHLVTTCRSGVTLANTW